MTVFIMTVKSFNEELKLFLYESFLTIFFVHISLILFTPQKYRMRHEFQNFICKTEIWTLKKIYMLLFISK